MRFLRNHSPRTHQVCPLPFPSLYNPPSVFSVSAHTPSRPDRARHTSSRRANGSALAVEGTRRQGDVGEVAYCIMLGGDRAQDTKKLDPFCLTLVPPPFFNPKWWSTSHQTTCKSITKQTCIKLGNELFLLLNINFVCAIILLDSSKVIAKHTQDKFYCFSKRVLSEAVLM